MTTPYIGQIMLFAGTFAPVGWQLCDGSLLPISQYDVLFALIGTTYGGDGQTTFAVPDLRSRVPVHQGQGQGLSNQIIGQVSGVENITLIATQIPLHTHALQVSSAAATTGTPSSGVTLGAAAEELYSTDSPNSTLNAGTITSVGGNQPHTNIQPYLALNFVIAYEGIFPTQS
jgi:microcystin-dependent protein